jgi:hypothetical protein
LPEDGRHVADTLVAEPGRFHECLEREQLRWRSDVVQPDSDPDSAHWRAELARPLDD